MFSLVGDPCIIYSSAMLEAKSALIIGIAGQDGLYLTELLLAKSYAGHNAVSRTSNRPRSRMEYLCADQPIYGHRLFLDHGDMSDGIMLRRIFAKMRPAEIYYLAGQSSVGPTLAECRFPGPMREIGNNFLRHALRPARSPEQEQAEAVSLQARG